MAVSQLATEKFLSRPLENWDWIKRVPDKKWDKLFSDLDPAPVFPKGIELYTHQKACFVAGIENNEFLYFADMGLGKSLLSLALFHYRKRLGQVNKLFVLVPNTVAIDSWQEECEKYYSDLRFVGLYGTTEERRELLEEDGDVYVVNYQGLLYLCTEKKRGKKGKNKQQLVYDLVDDISDKFDMVVFDESQNFKSWQSTTFKICSRLSENIEYRYALTGTPHGRDPHDLWPQFFVIDKGKTLGYTLGIFRSAFFNSKKNFWGGYEYTFKKKMENQLNRMIKNRSIFYSSEECIDLPPKIYRTKKVPFPVDTFSYYKQYQEDIRKADGNKQILENSFIKMRQISSGFLKLQDEDGDTFDIKFDENPKLEMLLELIREIPEDKKIIIFHEFVPSGNIISEALDKEKIKHTRLWSGEKDKVGSVQKFKKDKDYRIFLVNSKSGNSNLNLQVANYVIYFESPTSPIIRAQSEKRAHRGGQKASKVFYFDLVMKNSVDERILSFLKEGKDLFDAIIKGKEKI